MEAIKVIDTTCLVPLPSGRALMVGAPPEALKVVTLWELPPPSAVVVPPDPLFAYGINQASFEFLLFNHLFMQGGLTAGIPFEVVCDESQAARISELVRHMLHGPGEEEMAACEAPAHVRRQLVREMNSVNSALTSRSIDTLVRVTPLRDGRATLLDGARLSEQAGGRLRVESRGEEVTVDRRPQSRAPLPLYFADVDRPLLGPRFGLQVIGSASGFSGAEWGSCFIVWINGLPLLVDGTPYLDEHLARLGVEDRHILGYVVTHNHEDHANAIGQLISTRRVTLLTSGPVMATLVARLQAILDCPAEEVRKLFTWVRLRPGLQNYGPPLNWFGAEIRSWYSVHTIPTLGLDFRLDGQSIRMPGDTLWGRQLDPLVQEKVISPARRSFILATWRDAEILVADAGGGPVHPDPDEVRELAGEESVGRLLVTHVTEDVRGSLPAADPGTSIALIPRHDRSADDATALFGSPVLAGAPERWLLALLQGGELVDPPAEPVDYGDDGILVMAGLARLESSGAREICLQRGDIYHRDAAPHLIHPRLVSAARWTRYLRLPRELLHPFLADAGLWARLRKLYKTRSWWGRVIGEDLGLETLVNLGEKSREREFRPGEIIVRQGDTARTFYVVTDGEVQVLRRDGDEIRRLGRFGAGFHFGEIALLEADRRTATVEAVTAVRVLEVPSRVFRRELLEIPAARYRIFRLASERRSTHQLARNPVE